jgi:adenosylcobinamide kinase/adenosylcobinamide-phosphate guanylyltransferase
MRERIRRHRADRPSGWATVEEPVQLRRALDEIEPADTIVIDCLSLWVSNLVEHGWTVAEVEEEAADIAKRAASRPGSCIAVSNEAGLGVVPATPLGRRWRDLLGRVNERWAREAGDVFLVVAGRVLPLERVRV